MSRKVVTAKSERMGSEPGLVVLLQVVDDVEARSSPQPNGPELSARDMRTWIGSKKAFVDLLDIPNNRR